jgi:hypothetical protein
MRISYGKWVLTGAKIVGEDGDSIGHGENLPNPVWYTREESERHHS